MNDSTVKQHNQSNDREHHHENNIAVYLYFFCLVAFLVALLVSSDLWKMILYLTALVTSSYHIIIEGFIDTFKKTLNRKKFTPNVHILMTLAAIGAVIIDEYMEAALLILIFAAAHFLEHYAESKSNKEITSLLELNPTTARRIKEKDRKSTRLNSSHV